jgi:hypothetical protein
MPTALPIRPDQFPERMRFLQATLLSLAEEHFGTRDGAFTISDPVYGEIWPQVRFAPNRKTVWVRLSTNAAGYWPSAVWELAHECVHLLNPVVGDVNFLEEGFAVAFQQSAAASLTGVKITNDAPYLEAEALVGRLDKNVVHAGKLIRQHIGAFSKATSENLRRLFPAADRDLLQKLIAKCPTTNR